MLIRPFKKWKRLKERSVWQNRFGLPEMFEKGKRSPHGFLQSCRSEYTI